jgi:hypothetical protein
MADLILEFLRAESGNGAEADAAARVARIAARLSPDIIEPRPPRCLDGPRLRGVVVNPSAEGVHVADGGVMLGVVMGPAGEWWRVGSEPPDGTFALVRHDADAIELVTDVTGSRALWYALDDERLIVSTSQRAVVALLGDLRLDREAVTWFLLSGTLGPESVWDERVRRVPSDARLTVNRHTWRSGLVQQPCVFAPQPYSRQEHLEHLREAVSWSCAELDISPDRWPLPLSGGRDSRAILDALAGAGRTPPCLTWTTRGSLRQPLSDAQVARVVARALRAEHRYVYFDRPADGFVPALQRFVELGEGAIDAFAAYVDGCAMWAGLYDEGACGVIRGDEPLVVRTRMASYEGARRHAHGTYLSDYPEDALVRRLGLVDQTLPERLLPRSDEEPTTYRDRLSHQLYIPYVMAPLTEIKCRFVEVANPLLSRRVVAVARSFPEELRRYGRALPAIVAPQVRYIPHARYASAPGDSLFLEDEGIVAEMVATLTGPAIAPVLGEEAAVTLLAAPATPSHSSPRMRQRVVTALKPAKVALPSRMKFRYKPPYQGPDSLSATRLAFRAMVAAKALALLGEDAERPQRRPDRAGATALGSVSSR